VGLRTERKREIVELNMGFFPELYSTF